MSSATAPNSRASLLANLRTGGVRSVSQPIPHTAAPGGSFQIPRITEQQAHFPEEDEADAVAEMMFTTHLQPNRRFMQPPMTAAIADGGASRFQQQQQQQLFRHAAVQRAGGMALNQNAQSQAQAQLQLQVMQMEMLKMQALQQVQQAQQYQAELMAQAQRQQVLRTTRRPSGHPEPSTAGPMVTSFNAPGLPPPHLRREVPTEDLQVPMTAALGGRFGSRSVPTGLNPSANAFSPRIDDDEQRSLHAAVPPTPNHTTVISGGTPLGTPTTVTPSKSDSAVSWRRGSATTATPPVPRVVSSSTPKSVIPESKSAPSGLTAQAKGRPLPLRFGGSTSASVPTLTIDASDAEDAEDSESSKGSQLANQTTEGDSPLSSPTTPPSAGSSNREEPKKPYDGVGLGRPAPVAPATTTYRAVSQPTRQPRGPPSGADELGPRNFATRVRRKVAGGLGILANARVRRESFNEVEAY